MKWKSHARKTMSMLTHVYSRRMRAKKQNNFRVEVEGEKQNVKTKMKQDNVVDDHGDGVRVGARKIGHHITDVRSGNIKFRDRKWDAVCA